MAGGPILRRFFNGQVDLVDQSLVVGKGRRVLGDFLDLRLLERARNRRPSDSRSVVLIVF